MSVRTNNKPFPYRQIFLWGTFLAVYDLNPSNPGQNQRRLKKLERCPFSSGRAWQTRDPVVFSSNPNMWWNFLYQCLFPSMRGRLLVGSGSCKQRDKYKSAPTQISEFRDVTKIWPCRNIFIGGLLLALEKREASPLFAWLGRSRKTLFR